MKNKIKMLLNSIELLFDNCEKHNVTFEGKNQYDIAHELIDAVQEASPPEKVTKLKLVE